MAQIPKRKSALQNFSDRAMEAIRGKTRGGSVSVLGKDVLSPQNKINKTQETKLPSTLTFMQSNLMRETEKSPKTGISSSVYTPDRDLSFLLGSDKKTIETTTEKKAGTGTGTEVDTKTATQETAKPTLSLTNEEAYLRKILKDPNSDEGLKNWAIQQGKTYGIDITQPTLEELRTGATEAQKAFIESGIQSQLTGLEAGRQKALSTIEQQRGLIAPQFQQLRTQASNQAMQQARNLAEYRAARGQAMSGLRAQEELQMGAELQGRFGQIGLAEQQAIQDLENKKTEIGLDYDTRISQATSEGERQKQSFELEQKLAEISRVEKEMLQKIEDAKQIEQDKIKVAAETAKDETDFQRKKELITFETNESIRAAEAKAKVDASKSIQIAEAKSKLVNSVPFDQRPEFLNLFNAIDMAYNSKSTGNKSNELEDIFLDDNRKLNTEAINMIIDVRNEFGKKPAEQYEKYLKDRLGILIE